MDANEGKQREEGKTLLEEAFTAGEPEAYYTKAHILLKGQYGYEMNREKAIEYLQLAAQYDHVDSLYSLGILSIGQNDIPSAITYFERAMDKGNMISNGDDHIFSLLQKGAKLHDSNCLYNIALVYLYGEYNQNQDYEKARNYLIQSGKAGNAEGYFHAASMYYNGDHVTQDFKKAFEYYKLSSDLGNMNAMFNLGVMYLKGEGTDKNELKGKDLIELAKKHRTQ
ncbi:hypothetical protein WA158_006892 [Blastocystis sp. Blastoise]